MYVPVVQNPTIKVGILTFSIFCQKSQFMYPFGQNKKINKQKPQTIGDFRYICLQRHSPHWLFYSFEPGLEVPKGDPDEHVISFRWKASAQKESYLILRFLLKINLFSGEAGRQGQVLK